MTAPAPLFVICDRCRAEGLAGEDPFEAFGALLDFEPVPRRKNRADGWDSEVQRAYIAALSLTGSKRQAARAVGKAAFGVDQLLAAEGSEGFRAAHDEAMAMAADERGRRLAEGVRAVAGERSGWRPAAPPWSRSASRSGPRSGTAAVQPPPGPGAEAAPPPPLEIGAALEAMDDVYLDTLFAIIRKYRLKLEAEHRCRHEGRIAEADFYLRQMTMLEVSMDVVSGNGMEVLKRARLGDYGLLAIAETGMSIFLDGARREYWEEQGAPPRPEYPPRHLLEQKDGFATEPLTTSQGFSGEGAAEKKAAIDAQCARDARAQVEWEAEALRDHERRRDGAADS
ncbi:MAG TPA: hypothetical protein VE053_16215 [Allosphingosinicella sp.]|nr:hypothetical protein [Allosphingosinicella sp.]